MKVVYFTFGSTLSGYASRNQIFEIKATEYNTKTNTLILSGSGKTIVSFGSLAASTSPKSSGGGLAAYSSRSGSGGSRFGS